MKKLQMRLIMVAIAFATILVGCKPAPVEQSSVSIDDFKETATITGTLQYDEGQDFDGTKYTRLIKPAANITVTAVIANSEFSATTTGSGNLTYTATTDAKGNFEIKVPVTSKGVEVRVKAANFTGQYHRVIDVKDGKPVYTHEEGIYRLEDQTFTLEPNDVEVADGVFTYTERENEEEYIYYSEYKVIVGQQAYSKTTDENDNAKVIKQYKEAKGVDIIIEVEFENETFKYVASTDNDGIATFNIPTYTMTWKPKIHVTANPFAADKFTYYTLEDDEEEVGKKKAVKYTLSGKFEQVCDEETDYIDNPSFNSIESLPAPEFKVKMKFESFDMDEDHGHANEYWGDIEF